MKSDELDDFYTLLQQTFDQMNNPPIEEHEIEEEKQIKTKGLKEILSSLLLIEEQEKSESLEWEKSQQQDQIFFQQNHEKKTKAMFDYETEFKQLDHVLDQSVRVGKRKSRAATNAAIVSVIAGESARNNEQATATTAAPQRRLWVKTRSTDWWDKCNSHEFPEKDFKKAFRMGKDTFELICNELNSVVAKENTMLRDAVPVRQRVAVCIWRLATGEPLRLVSRRFGLGISTCHKLVLEVCSAIKNVLMPKYLQWPDNESIRMIKDEFGSVSGIPNVIGSMYTTHIPIIAPKISVAAYFNKRHTERNQKTSYSITVQGVVDPRGVFTDVCIGWPGSMPDDQVLEKSALFQRANKGLLTDSWIVGSSSYPLMDWVLVPYTQPHLTWTQHAFNEKIGDLQKIAKESFSRLKGRWSCLQKRTEVKLQDLPVVLGACCVLHNICEMRNEEIEPELMIEVMDDEMMPEIGLRSSIAMKARDSIAHNLLHHNHAGSRSLTELKDAIWTCFKTGYESRRTNYPRYEEMVKKQPPGASYGQPGAIYVFLEVLAQVGAHNRHPGAHGAHQGRLGRYTGAHGALCLVPAHGFFSFWRYKRPQNPKSRVISPIADSYHYRTILELKTPPMAILLMPDSFPVRLEDIVMAMSG